MNKPLEILDVMERKRIDLIRGARIAFEGWDPHQQYDIFLKDGNIKAILSHEPSLGFTGENILDAKTHLIAPSLCHAHIHLDKCFLLSDPKYADLEIEKGDFQEALELTSKAKGRFEKEDLIRRGRWLIGESIAAGVTHMRAFAEVDHVVEFKCLDAAIELKKQFATACEIQICAFAQDPIYSGEHGDMNRKLMIQAIQNEHVEVLGTTPYVEETTSNSDQNMDWAVNTAIKFKKHMDFHLDYNLDPSQKARTWYAIELALLSFKTAWKADKTIALGHCTRLTLLDQNEWRSLAKATADLPFYFIGLPTSDIYMRGKPNQDEAGGERVRGTLQIPQMIQKYGLRGAISINNVGNAFTPQGSCDPLSLASMGVGLYHVGTKADSQLLYECVSRRAKEAIGYASSPAVVGEEANLVLFDMGRAGGPLSQQRGRRTLQDIVYDPPKERKTIYKGYLINA